MADDTAKKEEKSDKTTAPNAADKTTSAETTTTNDGAIAINQPAKAAEDQPPAAAKKTEEVAPEPPTEPKTEDSLIQTPETTAPVVVSDADVAAAEKESDPHTSLSEQIEVLTGEVQALQSKIEKLTSGVSEAPVVPSVPPTNSEPPPVLPAPPAVSTDEVPVESMNLPGEKEDASIAVTPAEEKAEPAPDKPSESPAPAAVPVATTPVNDIYNKLLDQHKEEPKTHKDLNDDATLEEGSSGIGTIGEVLIVFGLISLLILAASPFVKTTIGSNWEALKSIGWPTATISLGLGFLLFLFNKGRVLFKIFALLLVLVAAVMTAAIFDYGSMLGPLSGFLDPIASFYK